jgi:excisionase family DNA binding protein
VIEQDPMLTVIEVAALLRVSKWTVYRLIEDGALKAIRVGRGKGSIRVFESAYKSYVARCETATQTA